MLEETIEKPAYLRMMGFLEAYVAGCYDITIGELLGSIDLNEDGVSMDPAATNIWNSICREGGPA